EVSDVVLQLHRVGRLVVDDGVDGHGDVVLGDDFLRLDVDDLLPHVDFDEPLDERHDPAEPGVHRLLVSTEELDQALFERPYDSESGGGDQDGRGGQNAEQDDYRGHVFLSLSFSVFDLLDDQTGASDFSNPDACARRDRLAMDRGGSPFLVLHSDQACHSIGVDLVQHDPDGADPAVGADAGLLRLVLAVDVAAQVDESHQRNAEEDQPLGQDSGADPGQDGGGGSTDGERQEEEACGEDLAYAHHDGQARPQPSPNLVVHGFCSFPGDRHGHHDGDHSGTEYEGFTSDPSRLLRAATHDVVPRRPGPAGRQMGGRPTLGEGGDVFAHDHGWIPSFGHRGFEMLGQFQAHLVDSGPVEAGFPPVANAVVDQPDDVGASHRGPSNTSSTPSLNIRHSSVQSARAAFP